MTSPVQVLYIGQDPEDFAKTTTYLDQQVPHIGLKIATSFSEAKTFISSIPFDSIVLDYKLPDGTALDFLMYLKQIGNCAVPILLLESADYVKLARVLEVGACFHLVKGDQYWECLPSLIAQAVEYSRLLDKEKRLSAGLGLEVDALTARLEIYEKMAADGKQPGFHPLSETLAHERDELMSRVSHEIKTPLTAVLGFAHMMVSHPDAPLEKRQKWAAFIESKSEQLNRLVDNMLDLSDLQAGHLVLNKRRASLGIMIRDAVESMEAIAPDRAFKLDVSKELPEISVDVDRIAQVILNMLSNALKLSPEGQPVEVTLRHQKDQQEVRVVDHGNGLEPDEREYVFEAFSAEPGAGYQPGKGLWLPLARALIEAHGGRMWIEPTADHGSTFILALPEKKP